MIPLILSWRLMASVLVVSDTGSVTMVAQNTDWPSEQACQQAIETMYRTPPSAQIGKTRLDIRTNAQCIFIGNPMAGPAPAYAPGPAYGPYVEAPQRQVYPLRPGRKWGLSD